VKAIDIKITGIKCDNPECNFRQAIKPEEYEQWINRPCPKCGQNLLTLKDYMAIMGLITIVNLINKFIPVSEEKHEKHEVMKFHIEMNGTGEMRFRPYKEKINKID